MHDFPLAPSSLAWSAGRDFTFYKTLRKYFQVSRNVVLRPRRPVAALYVRFGGSHPYVRRTNVLTCYSSSHSALWEHGVSVFWPIMSLE